MSGSMGYSGAPKSTDKVALVRLALGDTDPDDPLFTDAEVTVVLELQPIVTYAAAALAEMAAAKFARLVSVSIGSTSISNESKFQHYTELAKRLRETPGDLPGGDGSGVATLVMTVKGITKSGRRAFLENTDAIQPSFSIGQDDYPGTPDAVDDDRWR